MAVEQKQCLQNLDKISCLFSEDMEITSDSEETANYHQILEFFEMCANLITTLAR